jgi:hypothetical protein
MSREALQQAADAARTAAKTAPEDADRLEEIAGQIESRAEGDRGPDHGRMARWQNALSEVKADVSGDASDAIDDAKAAISEYRETVEGV